MFVKEKEKSMDLIKYEKLKLKKGWQIKMEVKASTLSKHTYFIVRFYF